MSKDIIVLTPNGRRQKIHCTPDTSILQVLEDVCQKQGFEPAEYDLKHHNHLLDLTTTVRFSNLPNKATLEMVETDRKREETNVTIGLLLEDGERRTAEFPPNTSLYDLIKSLAEPELNSLQHPSISYMRQEVTGETALREKTLRQLGLIKGRAILRLLNKTEEARQANVSAVYRRPVMEKRDDNAPKSTFNDALKSTFNTTPTSSMPNESLPGPSAAHTRLDPVELIRHEKNTHNVLQENIKHDDTANAPGVSKMQPQLDIKSETPSNTTLCQDNLERRLRIEEEVTFLGAQKAIAFMQPDNVEDDLDDLPDEFYELTIEEVRRLYHDLQQHRLELENTPLITSTKRDQMASQSLQKLNTYKNVVVRVQFPDHMILQGVFSPSDTIEAVTDFIRDHLEQPDKPFHIFTTPFKETLDSKMTLQDAKFVPCVHMHFKWLEDDIKIPYLKQEIYTKKTSSDAASLLASKYRAPSRRKLENPADASQGASEPSASTSKNSKVPKWFKN